MKLTDSLLFAYITKDLNEANKNKLGFGKKKVVLMTTKWNKLVSLIYTERSHRKAVPRFRL